MVRISDGRTSGTGFGTVIIHIAPEASIGGRLALVRDGDLIELDVEQGRLDLCITDEELAIRRAAWAAGLRSSDPTALLNAYRPVGNL
jgi:L-arabonate dehydrase